MIVNCAPTVTELGIRDGGPNYAYAYFSLRDYLDKISAEILPGENFYPPAVNDNNYRTEQWQQLSLIEDTPS